MDLLPAWSVFLNQTAYELMRSVPHYLHHYPIVSHNEIIKEWFNTFAIDLYT